MPGMAAGGRILLAYLIYFAAIGAAFPYLPVFYHDIGLGLEQIGVLTALQAAIQLLLAPVWGGLADRFPHTRLTLPLAAAVATVGATILFRADDFPTVLVGSLILYAGLSGIAPTLDARTLETLGTERRSRYRRGAGVRVARVRSGDAGRRVRARCRRRPRAVLDLHPVPDRHGRRDGDDPAPRRDATRSTSCAGPGSSWPRRGSSCSSSGSRSSGRRSPPSTRSTRSRSSPSAAATGLVGIAWAFGASIEVPIMYAFPRIGRRVGTERLVVIGTLAFALRALLASLIVDPVALVLVAPLEGIGFAFVFVGGVTVIGARAPAGLQGTSQGMFSAASGLATIIGSVLGGAIAGALGIPGLFLLCAVGEPDRDGDRRVRLCSARGPRRRLAVTA